MESASSINTADRPTRNIWVLQGRLELQPGGGYHQPQRGIGQGHPWT